MKAFLFALLLAVAGPAMSAAPHCWPNTSFPVTIQIASAQKVPVQLGQVVYAASSTGLVWGYSCKQADGTWWLVIAGGAWDKFPADWVYILDNAMRNASPLNLTALWEKYATATAWDERLRPDLDAVWALLPRQPAPSVWKVLADPFRPDKKRLVYTVAGGMRGPPVSPSQYVDAGAPCNPAITITEFGNVTFMSVLGNLTLVARCTQ